RPPAEARPQRSRSPARRTAPPHLRPALGRRLRRAPARGRLPPLRHRAAGQRQPQRGPGRGDPSARPRPALAAGPGGRLARSGVRVKRGQSHFSPAPAGSPAGEPGKVTLTPVFAPLTTSGRLAP